MDIDPDVTAATESAVNLIDKLELIESEHGPNILMGVIREIDNLQAAHWLMFCLVSSRVHDRRIWRDHLASCPAGSGSF